MNEEQTSPLETYEFINVYGVNDDVVVAKTIEDAIELWKKTRLTHDTISKIELLNYKAKIKRQSK